MISMGAIIAPLWLFGYNRVEVWNTVAASLAVITAVISAWITQTLFEKQEDAQRPYPYPMLDTQSRPHLFQLRVINKGGSAAYDIRLNWDQPLLNSEGKPIRFSQRDPEIPILLPNESITTLIDVSHRFLNKYNNAEYFGEIEYKDDPTSNKVFKHKFYINANMYRKQMVYTSQEQETHDKLQELPDEISKVTKELERLRYDLKEIYKPTDMIEDPIYENAIKKAKELGDPVPNLPESQD